MPGDWSSTNFFFLIYNQHRVMISAGERENHRERSTHQGEPRFQENAILPIFAQQPCTGGLHIYTERLSFARSKTGNQSPDAVKGLPSHDLNCTPFEGFLWVRAKARWQQREKKISRLLPPWVGFTEKLRTSVLSDVSHTFHKNLLLSEVHILDGLMHQ